MHNKYHNVARYYTTATAEFFVAKTFIQASKVHIIARILTMCIHTYVVIIYTHSGTCNYVVT